MEALMFTVIISLMVILCAELAVARNYGGLSTQQLLRRKPLVFFDGVTLALLTWPLSCGPLYEALTSEEAIADQVTLLCIWEEALYGVWGSRCMRAVRLS